MTLFGNILGTRKYGCPLVVLGLVSWFVLNSNSTQSLRLGKNGTQCWLERNDNTNGSSLNRRLLNVNRSYKTTWRGDLCRILSKNSRSLPDLVKNLQISTKSSRRSWDLLHIWSEISSSLPDMDREFDGKGRKKGILVGLALKG